jgi:NADPH2:quinone reductase
MSNKAIAISQSGGVEVLHVTSLPLQAPIGWDILVKNYAVSVNPVDAKQRAMHKNWAEPWRVLGYDGAGVVEDVGPNASSLWKKGDEVWYAGNVTRNGSNSQYTLVDGRIVGRKPKNLDWVNSAAFPLVVLTAYELLVEKMGIQKNDDGGLLIVNAAGGVGSVAVQLAARVLGVTNVIATASRKETIDWVKKLGATHVINHREPLEPQIKNLGLTVKYVALFYDPDAYIPQVIPFIQPFGKIGSILSPQKANFLGAHMKSITIYFESMFAKSMNGVNPESQGQILSEFAQYVDDKKVIPILTNSYPLNLENLQKAHQEQESGTVLGKIALSVEENSFN